MASSSRRPRIELPGVVVIGAGPVGSLAAIYLRRRGFSVDVFEALPDMRLTTATAGKSINLILTSRGISALHQVGLVSQILKICTPVYGRTLHIGEGVNKYTPYGPDDSYCNYAVSRRELNIALMNAAEAAGARIHFEHPIDHINIQSKTIYMYVKNGSAFRRPPRFKLTHFPTYEQYKASVKQQQQTDSPSSSPAQFAPGHTYGVAVKAQHIFACDGANSRARQSLHHFLSSSVGVADGVATPLGNSISAIRELDRAMSQAPGAEIVSNLTESTSTTTVTTTLTNEKENNPLYFPHDFNSALDLQGSYEVSVPLRVSYKELLLTKEQNTDSITGQPILDTKSLHIWPRGMHFLMALPNIDQSFTLTLYLPDRQYRNIPSFQQLTSDEAISAYFSTHYPDLLPALPLDDILTQWHKHPRGFLGTIQSYPYHYNDHILLMGDAAHAITPFFGQGCNFGMETVSVTFSFLDRGARIRVPNVRDGETITPVFDNISQNSTHYTPSVVSNAFSKVSGLHKINADAIGTMAVENYIEMGTKTADLAFLRKSQYETILHHHFPTTFLSRYAMVTHTLIPYSVCYVLGEIQNNIITTLINQETNNGKIELTHETLNSMPIIDIKAVKHMLQNKYVPILNKYRIDSHALRDVTRDIITSVLNKKDSDATVQPKARL